MRKIQVASPPASHNARHRRVLVDTNFLLMQYEYGIDLPGELMRIINGPFVLIITSGTLGEIKTLAGRAGKKAAAARFIQANIGKIKEKFGVETLPSEGPVDDWIIKYARNNEVTVATNDLQLRARLRGLGVPAIGMISKAKLGFI